MSSVARKLSAAILASGALIVAGTTGASAASCKGHKDTATGSASIIQYLASVSAKNAWKSRVVAHDGTAYDTWGKASDKSVACKKGGPNKTWTCVARARPCK